MNVIEAHHVAKRYRQVPRGGRRLGHLADLRAGGSYWALRDVSFSVRDGETVGLIGRNGAGKSTLLRLLAGVTTPTRGSLEVRRRVSGLLTLGEGFQQELTGEENALTAAILAGLTRRQALERLPAVAEFAELEDVVDQPLRTYSDGMRLRLAFAVAVHVDPELLLIDEVLSVGDLRFRQKCLRHLEGVQAAGVTVVLSSHELEQVERMCQRAVWLEDGRVRMHGPAEEVTATYRRAAAEAAGPVEAGEDGSLRMGDRRVEITAVRFVGARPGRVPVLVAGEPVTVELDYLARTAVPDVIFGISAHTEDGSRRCFDVSTAADGEVVGVVEGPGTVRLRLGRVDLGGGAYRLDVGAYAPDWSEPYDYQWAAYPFEVWGTAGNGLLDPPRAWELA